MTYFGFPGIRHNERRLFRAKNKKDIATSFNEKVERWKIAVELATSFKFDDLITSCRKPDLANIRAIIAFHLYTPKVISFEKVAKIFGDRDHTSVMFYVKKKYPNMKRTWPEFSELEERLLHYL